MTEEITKFVYEDVELAYNEGTLIALAHNKIGDMKSRAWELAEILYHLRASVQLGEGEKFRDWAALEYGLSPYTIDRYVNVWDTILFAPQDTKINLLEKEINTMIPLGTNLANGGVALEEVDWDRVEDIDSNGEMRALIREIKDIPERSGTITFQIDNGGDIIAWSGEEREFVGFIEQNPMTEFGKKAVARITHYLKGQ